MAILNNSNAISAGGYNIDNSLRFRASNSAYLSRTPSSTGNRQTFTYSFWVKRGTLGTLQRFVGVSDNATGDFIFQWTTSNTLEIYDNGPAGTSLITTQVFRDPSAWYHIVITYDTTNATSSNRVRVYVNGSQVTAFGTAVYPAQNTNSFNNQASIPARIGIWPSGSQYFDGYFAEFNFIDGSAKAASDFGETDTTTGVWKPKAYTGTYGTNGFYLKFSDIATTSGSNAGLGKDFSGNTNYWTTNNISVTSGTTYDAMIDSPTNASSGTRPVGNYAVLNPLDTGSNITLSAANLQTSQGAAAGISKGTIGISSGKWYWEVTLLSGTTAVGIADITSSRTQNYVGQTSTSYGYYSGNGNKYNNATGSAYGASYTTNDVIGVALDMDAGTLVFYKNNSSQGTAYSSLSGTFTPAIGNDQSNTTAFNAGQRPFSYTPPTGYQALCTTNLPTPTILQGNKYMDATLYTGTGATQVVTNSGSMKPDLVWLKSRSNARNHRLMDTVRGINLGLQSDLTSAEFTGTALSSINSNGFTLNTTDNQNVSSEPYVGWQWQAGQGTNTTNTAGTITSTVSVNATAGFSVVTYTGNNTLSTVGHGLGVSPKMIIVKDRSNTNPWVVYHVDLGVQKYIFLNATDAAYSNLANYWSATAPSSTVFGINAYGGINTNADNYVAYCFAAISGYSAFGSYTGNGSSDGSFIYTGFLPKFIMIKCTDTAGTAWVTYDTARDTYNVAGNILLPNSSSAELSGYSLDVLSNGFKHRQGGGDPNASSRNYIYACFASNPFAGNNRAR